MYLNTLKKDEMYKSVSEIVGTNIETVKKGNWLLLMTAASFLVFGLFYLVVYRLTSNTYYKIVVSRSERE